MKVLIVYAHPDTDGHNPLILREVVDYVKASRVDYKVLDLYKLKYDPVLHAKELYTAGNRSISKQNKEFQKLILNSDHLIFISPVWWNDVPAILKGFFDRVLTPGFAYKFENKRPKGLLKGKSATVFLTTGASDFLYWLFERNIASRILKTYILGFCGIKSKVFRIGGAHTLDDKQKLRIKKTVDKALSSHMDTRIL